jgi:translation elongation factor P/translation initiation factor 5A
VQLEARDLRTGAKRTEARLARPRAADAASRRSQRFRPSDAVERVAVEEQSWTFLYAEGRRVVLMHPESFEQARRAGVVEAPLRSRAAAGAG